MITYLLNFTLCSALLLLGYHLLLKSKTMFVFNRLYLLFSIVFSLGVPFAVVKYNALPVQTISPATEEIQILQNNNAPAAKDQQEIVPAKSQVNYQYYYISVAVYAAITLLLLFRFVRNLNIIRLSVLNNKRTSYKGAQLVLIEDELTPHTFLNYIFLNKERYLANHIERDILSHELTHARQYHTADVIFIELVQVFCWFNPFIWLYKKAIQLNHEFIADAAVLDKESDITGYQQLLLNNLGYTKSLTITSQFNYSVTKKRLIMMSKNTSAIAAMLTKLAIIPLIAIAFVLFSTKTEASNRSSSVFQDKQVDTPKKIVRFPPPVVRPINAGNKAKVVRFAPPVVRNEYPSTKEGATAEQMKEYDSITSKYLTPDHKSALARPHRMTEPDYKRLVEIFQQMSREQQKQQVIGFNYPGMPLPMVHPTQQQLTNWKDAKTYGLWINEKHVANTELDKYKPNDFDQVFVSKLMKTAINHKNYKYQVDLMTKDYYQDYLKKEDKQKYKSIPYFGFYKAPDKTK